MIDQMEGLNIKDFVIETPVNRGESPFDPKVDFPPTAWKGIVDDFQLYKDDLGNREFAEAGMMSTASYVKILEGKTDRSRIAKLTENEWAKVDTRIEGLSNREEWGRYLLLLKHIHIVDPEHAKEEKYQIGREQRREIKDNIAEFFRRNNDSAALSWMSMMTIISPEEKFVVPDNFWGNIENLVKSADFEKYASVVDRSIARSVILGVINNSKILEPETAKTLFSDIATAKLNVRFGRENTGYLLAA